MVIIIVGLIVLLVIAVVVFNGIQQHKQKQEQERRAKSAKYKAIIDESDDLIQRLTKLPPSPTLINILHKRSFNAASAMLKISPDSKHAKQQVQELGEQVKASSEHMKSKATDDTIILPDDEQLLVGMLQTIKKTRLMLKSELSKSALDPKIGSQQDLRLDGMQLKINVESLINRGKKAYSKEMWGSARQYFEKALQTLSNHPNQSEYTQSKKDLLEGMLEEITKQLVNTNAQDAAKKSKDEEDDLDMLFQPKKKW